MAVADRRNGLVKRKEKVVSARIEWVGRTKGDKIRFGVVEGYKLIKGVFTLISTQKMVIQKYRLDKIKADKIIINVLKEWNK